MYWVRGTDEAACGVNDVARATHLFRVLKVLEQGLLVPGNTLVNVGGRVRESLALASLATEDTESHMYEHRCGLSKLEVDDRLTRGG